MHRLSLLLLSSTIVILTACAPPSTAPATPTPVRAVAVQAAPVQRTALRQTLTLTGDVRSQAQVPVVARVGGRVEKVLVEVGQTVPAGAVLAELETATLQAQLAQAQAALEMAQARLAQLKALPRPEQVAQAEANLRAAQARLAQLKALPRPETVAQARANLEMAQARLAQLKAGPTKEQLEAARLAVDQAKNAAYAANAERDGICGNRLNPRYLCDAANARALAAQTAVEQAEVRLRELQAGPTPEQVAQAEAAVRAAEEQLRLAERPVTPEEIAQAEAAVAAAEQQLRLARQPVTPEEIRAAEAQVEQARAGVELARLQLAEARIVAPFAGVVAERHVQPGAVVAPGAPVVSLFDPRREVVVSVDEGQLGLVRPGQEGTITSPALPGQSFGAVVRVVAPAVDPRTRTGTVRLEPTDPQGLLRPGMFVQVALTVAERSAALAVPRNALIPRSQPPAVFVVQGDRVRRQEIQTGLSDGEKVEVLQGLAEGDRVVLDPRDLRDGDLVSLQGG